MYMKNVLIALIVVIVLGAAGYFGYKYLARPAASAVPSSDTSTAQTSTATGLLMPGKGDDYSYVLLVDKGKTIGIASQKVDLSQYVNKRVEITGSYSGSTLYAYSVVEQ